MNDTDTTVTTKFFLDRVKSLFEEGPNDPRDVWTLTIMGGVLFLALVYMGLMYYKDSRSVGGLWATFLGLLRACVYAVLAFAFLKPSIQKSEQTVKRSKAVLGFDTSLSMLETSDPPDVT